MKRLSNIVWACILLLGTGAPAYAGTPGSSCSDAIPMGKDYSAQVRSGQTIWYSAWTFDLPLTVTFTPQYGQGEPAPEVEMDFTCIPGYYADSILCSWFCKTSSGGGIDFGLPHKPALSSKVIDGNFVYYLSLGKKYRDLLLQVGISYNVEVFVKVTYKCNGTIQLAPDDLFTNCVDNAKFMRYGDTVQVKAKDKNRHVIVPYVQWQEDTIYYKWTGTAPCKVVVANTCDFNMDDYMDDNIIEREEINPGDSAKVSAVDMYDWVHNDAFPNEAGMYFAKIYSEAPGTLKVIKAKQAQPDGQATLLHYDKIYPLDANSTAIYAIPRSWDKDVKFTTPTSHLFTMVLSKTAAFGAQDTLQSYSFEKTESGRWVGITSTKMKTLWNQIPTSSNYIYIRFICTEATTVMPERWYVSDCYKNTMNTLVEPGKSFTISKTSSTVYRFSYPQWRGGDMTINFAINSNCDVYLADTCGMTRSNQNAPYWLRPKSTVKSSTPVTITKEEIESWADRIDEEGHFYALFYTSATSTNRKLTITTDAPADADPEYPKTTIAVACEGTTVVVNVSEAQHIAIKSTTDAIVDQWDATPGVAHTLTLTAGKYTLEGENEQIEINL